MLAVDAAPRRSARLILGRASPRIAPPLPAVGRLADYKRAAEMLGITPYPWQLKAARYGTATTAKGLWLYRDVVIVVSRQNGKTEFLLPRITMALEDGESILHTAQDRALPRLTFEHLCDLITQEPELSAKVKRIRTANGTESIAFKNGGRYTLLAPGHGVRGHHGDLTIEDEVREQRDFRLQRAMGPTTIASRNPQRIYLSNAGDEDSVVLNGLRERMNEGGSFAYLEWSAAPERGLDDLAGWAEANPGLGFGFVTLDTLRDARRTQSPAGFETEHLCRWVTSMRSVVVDPASWAVCRGKLEKPVRPAMAMSMDPSGTRASLAMAWQQTDGTVAMRVVEDVTGSPIDSEALGKKWREMASRLGATVGFDPWTDADMARNFRSTKPINGREYANASEGFARLVEQGRLRWDEADAVTDDLAWTARKPHESGAWMAVKAKDDRPIPSVFAAIRAVWLVSGPRERAPRVY